MTMSSGFWMEEYMGTPLKHSLIWIHQVPTLEPQKLPFRAVCITLNRPPREALYRDYRRFHYCYKCCRTASCEKKKSMLTVFDAFLSPDKGGILGADV